MHVEVLKISQEIDMQTGEMSHVVHLRTNNGQVVSAKISDEASAVLITSFVAGSTGAVRVGDGTALPRVGDTVKLNVPGMEMSGVITSGGSNGGSGGGTSGGASGNSFVVFGGDDENLESPPPPPMPAVKRQIVGTDSHGYPLFAGGGVDPSTLTAGDSDEDGIGSL